MKRWVSFLLLAMVCAAPAAANATTYGAEVAGDLRIKPGECGRSDRS